MIERKNSLYYQQDMAIEWGKVRCLLTISGSELLGLPLKAPNSVYEKVYTLPLMTISMGKGTGVVTSVPSDAPDDFVALQELKDKPLWREKFGLTAEMVEPFVVVPIIGKFLTPSFLVSRHLVCIKCRYSRVWQHVGSNHV